jgi:hypothetical protein
MGTFTFLRVATVPFSEKVTVPIVEKVNVPNSGRDTLRAP